MTVLPRSSGVLLHPTSLPSGRLDGDAYGFVDWLAAAGQTWWQVLPIGPPDDTGSPYASPSAFAGWTGLLAEPHAPVSAGEVDEFVARHPYWIGGWAAFDGPGAVTGQVRFEREWGALRAYAGERGVRIFGDVPIYVAPDGADHRANPGLFQRGLGAGVPPDLFSDDGQHWGNPLYDWDALRATEFRWWVERFRRSFELFDLARLDHFRGFVAYWAVPAHHETARHGRWRRAPGRELFDVVRAELGELPLVAEDLGVITPPVERLRDDLGLPGMHVRHCAFDGSRTSPHRLENHRELGVVYTATHDTDTSAGWWATLPEEIRRASGLDPAEPAWSLIERAWSSRARLAIAPLSDVLGLGSEARMNTPGTETGNWSWRLRGGELTDEVAARLRGVTEAAGRV
jgi:4-alpha-glucanotransferase